MSRHRFLCLTCRVDTGKISEHYMLKDDVWAKIHDDKVGMFCIGCAEERLGRRLSPDDFTACHVNERRLYSRSIRLAQRLGFVVEGAKSPS